MSDILSAPENTGLLDKRVNEEWDVVYQKAELDDGTAYFPQKLPLYELEKLKRELGSYVYANQYLNEIIPSDMMRFKKEWFRYYASIPQERHTIAYLDPAIGQEEHHDFTSLVVVHTDSEKRWYVEVAIRKKLTPTQVVNLLFECYNTYKPRIIGIEDVAFQKALLYLVDEEMKERGTIIPVTGVKPSTEQTKEAKILTRLVPRLEWGRIFFNQGLHALEGELLSFPRGAHDDVVDGLASIDDIITYPHKENTDVEPSPGHPDYEKWVVKNLFKRAQHQHD